MTHTEGIAAIILAILGPGGLAGVVAILRQKGKGDPVPATEVEQAQVARAADASGLSEQWRAYADKVIAEVKRERDEERDRNDLEREKLAARIEALEKAREQDREQIAILERRDVLHQVDAYQLRQHIARGGPPPGPLPPPGLYDAQPIRPIRGGFSIPDLESLPNNETTEE